MVDVVEMVVDEGVDVRAGSLATVSDLEHRGDLAEREASGLGALDEPETADGGLVVVPVPGCGSTFGPEEAAGLIEAQRRGGHSDAGGEFSDEHAGLLLTFHRTGSRTVEVVDVTL